MERTFGVYSNLHIRSDSVRSVTAAVRALDILPAYVSMAPGRWVSVYPEGTEEADSGALIDAGARLSGRLSCAALAFLVDEGDSFRYFLFENGALVDDYESAPTGSLARPSEPRGGRPERLLPYCEAQATRAQLEELLRSRRVNGHSLMRESLDRLRVQIEAQRRHLHDTHPDLVSRLRALGSPTPALERMLHRFDHLAAQIARGVAGADILAEGVGQFIGLGPERCLVGYGHIRHGEAPPEMALLLERRS